MVYCRRIIVEKIQKERRDFLIGTQSQTSRHCDNHWEDRLDGTHTRVYSYTEVPELAHPQDRDENYRRI